MFLFKKKKAPLQSVIPINIIHLKNSIYIFIYRFLYIYFYVQDVLASCQRSISVGVGDGLGFIALGFQNLPFTRDALKIQTHPARRYQNKIKGKKILILKHIYNSSRLYYLCRTNWGFSSPPFPLSGNTLPAEPCGTLPPSGPQGGCGWPRQQHPSSSQGCTAPKPSHSQEFRRLSSAVFIQNQTISAPRRQRLP